MVYAARDNFHAAREFYSQALTCKANYQDEAGLALTHGQLGRLYLDWDQLDRAEEHFKEDRAIARRIGDQRGEALMDNHLGQVALVRGDAETAAAYLDQAIRRSREGGWAVLEGYAHKDRALAYLLDGDPDACVEQAVQAEALFRQANFPEGLAHVNRARGLILRARTARTNPEALRQALRHFERIARGSRSPARSSRWCAPACRPPAASRDPRRPAGALECAEACRRAALVEVIETELRVVDEVAYCRHAYQRVRGRQLRDDSVSLISGTCDTITVLFMDLKGSTERPPAAPIPRC